MRFMRRIIFNMVLFTVVSYLFLHLILVGFGEIAHEVEEEIVLNGTAPMPTYHPDVIIYESQKTPEDYGKIFTIVFSVLIAFFIVYIIFKLKATAIKYLVMIAMYISLTYSLRGLLINFPLIISLSLSAFFVFLLISKISPTEVKTTILALVVGGIGALLGSMAYPYIWASILAIMMIYDLIAVHKGPMKNIAKASIEMDIPLLIKIKGENAEHYIGLGDYVFPMSLIASLLKYGSLGYAITSLCGMFIGAVVALMVAEKRGPVPGLIYIVPLTLTGFVFYTLSYLL